MGNTKEKTEESSGSARLKTADQLIAVESMSVKCTFFCTTNTKLPFFYRLFLPPVVAATDLFSWNSRCVGRYETAAQEERDEKEWEDESCSQVEAAEETFCHILPRSLAMWPPRPEEFRAMAVHMSARHCLHVKAVIVVKYSFPSGKRERTV